MKDKKIHTMHVYLVMRTETILNKTDTHKAK